MTWILSPAILAAIALSGCGVEGAAPLTLPSSPRLTSMGTSVEVCPSPAPPQCTGESQSRCCLDTGDCSYKICPFESQVCKNDVCFMSCEADTDCSGDPTDDLICGKEKLCVPRGCTSNRGCGAGQVCQGPEDAGVCVTANESEPDPGCSASAASTSQGVLATAVFALILAGALARRGRRSE